MLQIKSHGTPIATDIALVGECSEASFGVALIGDTQSTERPQEFRVHTHPSITAHLRTDESKLTQHFTGGNKQKEDVGLVHQSTYTVHNQTTFTCTSYISTLSDLPVDSFLTCQ